MQLTARERQVVDLGVERQTNRKIATALGAGQKTVKAHRANAMEKTQAKSLAELVKMVLSINGD